MVQDIIVYIICAIAVIMVAKRIYKIIAGKKSPCDGCELRDHCNMQKCAKHKNQKNSCCE